MSPLIYLAKGARLHPLLSQFLVSLLQSLPLIHHFNHWQLLHWEGKWIQVKVFNCCTAELNGMWSLLLGHNYTINLLPLLKCKKACISSCCIFLYRHFSAETAIMYALRASIREPAICKQRDSVPRDLGVVHCLKVVWGISNTKLLMGLGWDCWLCTNSIQPNP